MLSVLRIGVRSFTTAVVVWMAGGGEKCHVRGVEEEGVVVWKKKSPRGFVEKYFWSFFNF
jgi:hypothetical protein